MMMMMMDDDTYHCMTHWPGVFLQPEVLSLEDDLHRHDHSHFWAVECLLEFVRS
jgi:hypothetical protein